jgi:hypothetical protein
MTLSLRLPILVAFLACLSLPGAALARSSGIFVLSQGLDCTACHNDAVGAMASFVMAPVNPDLPPTTSGYVAGAAYDVTVSVSGGPGVKWGFNWLPSGGDGIVTDPVNTQVNTFDPNTPDNEFTHTTAGSDQSSWSFQWVAPDDGSTVSLRVTGNSANGTGGTGGDAGVPVVETFLDPVPEAISVLFGNVNGGPDDVLAPLLINGSIGDDDRVVNGMVGGPLQIETTTYPGAPGSIPHAIYALLRLNTDGDKVVLPAGLGCFAYSIPVTGGGGALVKVVTNTLGHEPLLGTGKFAGAPNGPGFIVNVNVPNGLAGRTVVFQSILPDSTKMVGASVSNGVVFVVP